MNTQWIALSTAMLLSIPFAFAGPVDDAPRPGLIALLTFPDYDAADGTPTLYEGPGWDCTTPTQNSDGTWTTQCVPLALSGASAQAAGPACSGPRAVAGGTPVSNGTAYVRVACGTLSAECNGEWEIKGECLAHVDAASSTPVSCTALVRGKTTGGTLYAECANTGATGG